MPLEPAWMMPNPAMAIPPVVKMDMAIPRCVSSPQNAMRRINAKGIATTEAMPISILFASLIRR